MDCLKFIGITSNPAHLVLAFGIRVSHYVDAVHSGNGLHLDDCEER